LRTYLIFSPKVIKRLSSFITKIKFGIITTALRNYECFGQIEYHYLLLCYQFSGYAIGAIYIPFQFICQQSTEPFAVNLHIPFFSINIFGNTNCGKGPAFVWFKNHRCAIIVYAKLHEWWCSEKANR
jgi:hypothetical protein